MPAQHGGRPTGDGDRSGLPDDVVEDLRASERRRRLLDCLVETDEPIPVMDLARRIGARERSVPAEAVDDETVRQIRDEVYHEHLPKLTATEVVTYDSLVGTVGLATDDERLLGSDDDDSSE